MGKHGCERVQGNGVRDRTVTVKLGPSERMRTDKGNTSFASVINGGDGSIGCKAGQVGGITEHLAPSADAACDNKTKENENIVVSEH